MKLTIKSLLVALLALAWTVSIWAAGSRYTIRTAGLACPFCAAGMEKRLEKIKGVEHVDVDLQKGVVTVDMSEGVTLTEPDMKKVLKDAGFTYLSMERKPK